MDKKNERLFSLDLLRGLDMFALVVVAPFFYALNGAVKLPEGLMKQFGHGWGGFTFLDIIMPLFIFMCGAAVPFALGRRKENQKDYWLHVVKRVALLWFLGMLAQGRLFTLDLMKISPFNNTLQTIASGYLIAAAVFLIPNKWIRRAIPVALALVYAAVMHFGGDYGKFTNIAMRFEAWFVPLIMPAGNQAMQLADPGYTWWATIPMFGAMTLCGMEVTLMLSADEEKLRRYWKVFALGFVLLVIGLVAEIWIPCIKHFYSFSFTAQAMGWCCIALSLLYALTDILMFRRGFWIFTLFGQTALLAYMLIEVWEFSAVMGKFGENMTNGIPCLLGKFGETYRPVFIWLAQTILLVFLLHYRRRVKTAK